MESRKRKASVYVASVLFYYLINNCNSFIIPNELPSLLSIIYSNIPPVRVGFDTRFGLGFRLGPHADYQTLIEIGPQTNTNPLSSNGTVSKRQSNTPKRLHRLQDLTKNAATNPDKNFPQKAPNKGKKTEKTLVGKIEFKRIQGIDYIGDSAKNEECRINRARQTSEHSDGWKRAVKGWCKGEDHFEPFKCIIQNL